MVFLPFARRIDDHPTTLPVKILQLLPAGLAWAIVICLTGCTTPRRLITDPAPSAASGDSLDMPGIYDPKPIYVLQGKASFYGKPQPTASGERFNPKAMTAAHKTLPLHSVVRVVNMNNHKSVLVRINDRGPYVRGRIIDLSTAAAEKIAMLGSGVVPVKVEVLRKIDVMMKPNRKVVALSPIKETSSLKVATSSLKPHKAKPSQKPVKHRTTKRRKHHNS